MRYFIGYIVTIGLLIVLVLFLVTSGGKSNKTVAPPKLLNSYASTDAEVQLTIDGPITAPQLHQAVQIDVSAFQATYQQLQGYDGTVVNTRSYSNSENSYFAFLSSLIQAKFTAGTPPIKGMATDTGLCPLGDRYDVKLMQDGQTLEHYWATSCGGTSTYKGSLSLTLTLFQAQIPDYNTLISKTTL